MQHGLKFWNILPECVFLIIDFSMNLQCRLPFHFLSVELKIFGPVSWGAWNNNAGRVVARGLGNEPTAWSHQLKGQTLSSLIAAELRVDDAWQWLIIFVVPRSGSRLWLPQNCHRLLKTELHYSDDVIHKLRTLELIKIQNRDWIYFAAVGPSVSSHWLYKITHRNRPSSAEIKNLYIPASPYVFI